MEEKKTKSGQAQEKLSYDQLKQMASDLYQENIKLRKQLQDFDTTSFLLSMLFKVMDHADQYDKEFIDWSKKNIQAALIGFMEQITEPEEKKDEDK